MLLRADITWLLLTSDFNNKEVALGQEIQDGFREEGCPVVWKRGSEEGHETVSGTEQHAACYELYCTGILWAFIFLK